MPSPMAPGTMGMAVAMASPKAVNRACHGLRSRLRSAMRWAGERIRMRPMRSRKEGSKLAGGSGRIASAGGRLTAWRTAPSTPRKDAPALAPRARPRAHQSGRKTRFGNWKKRR